MRDFETKLLRLGNYINAPAELRKDLVTIVFDLNKRLEEINEFGYDLSFTLNISVLDHRTHQKIPEQD